MDLSMAKLYRFMEWMHLISGLIAAPLLLVLGLTGSFLVFEYPLDHFFNARLAYVQPAVKQLPLDRILANIRAAYPSAKVLTLSLSPSSPIPNLTYTASVQLPSARDPSTVYVNQYTGQVLGKHDGMSFATVVHEFHTDLMLGKRGAFVVMLTSCLLIVLSVSGMFLWWPRKIFTVRWSASARRVTFDLHNAIGFYCFLFMLIFSVTGVVVHWQATWLPIANRSLHLADNEPDLKISLPFAKAQDVTLDVVAATASRTIPGARLTQINMPGNSGMYRAWLKYPEDGTPLGRSFVLVNAYSGAVLYTRSARTIHVPTRFFREWNRELHTGDILGWPTRIFACVMSLMLPVLAITGPLFWSRKQRRWLR